jgi:hypothetical protein
LKSNAKALVSADEEQEVSRSVLIWLNTCPDKVVDRINFEFLPKDSPGMMLSTIQAAYKTRQYITGGYEAQYQFKLVYRAQPSDNDSRLAADEALNAIGAWAERTETKPDIGSAFVRSVRRDSDSALLNVYEDGTRDHQILMTLTYEVI